MRRENAIVVFSDFGDVRECEAALGPEIPHHVVDAADGIDRDMPPLGGEHHAARPDFPGGGRRGRAWVRDRPAEVGGEIHDLKLDPPPRPSVVETNTLMD